MMAAVRRMGDYLSVWPAMVTPDLQSGPGAARKSDAALSHFTSAILTVGQSDTEEGRNIIAKCIAKHPTHETVLHAALAVTPRERLVDGSTQQPAALSKQERLFFDKGKAIYRELCTACHAPDGRGVKALLAPPLPGSPRLTKNREAAIQIMLHGLIGEFFGFQDSSHFYYVHIAAVSDPHAHNIMLVNGKPRVSISETSTKGHDWGKSSWHTIRIVREIGSGKIEVFANDMTTPIMTATDRTSGAGWAGFGSFDDTGRVRAIRFYGEGKDMTAEEVPFFKKHDE